MRCATCAYFDPMPEGSEYLGQGFCRRYAPRPAPEPDEYGYLHAQWALVSRAEWCGEWLKRSGVKPAPWEQLSFVDPEP